MRRRDFLASTAAIAAAPAAPALAQGARARTLRFVPQANLTSLDPIWTTAAVTENHGWHVYDTLYGMTDDLRVAPQMAEGHTVSDDGRTWSIRLREGLRFHDGEQCARRIARQAWRAGPGAILSDNHWARWWMNGAWRMTAPSASS